MRLSFFILFSILILNNFNSYSQKLSTEETKLFSLINQYRKGKSLPPIPLSPSLTLVAQTHAKDLEQNYIWGTACNLHSWSDKGKWNPVCYTPDHAQAALMWKKPRELTNYQGNGYEIAFGGEDNYVANANEALEWWKKSKGHNALLINGDIWNKKWNAIGIGIYGSYAVVWFGNEIDQ
jgi:hypothetical protein